MRFSSLGSGSKGNATLVEHQNTCILLDCGFSMREAVQRMQRLGRAPEQITAILVTHEHGDHLRGVMPMARKYGIPVYLTAGTAQGAKADNCAITLIRGKCPFRVGELDIEPVAVPHDAREPVQFLFRSRRHCFGVLTDLGHITPHVVESYRECDGLLLEANHDPQMLASGPYPYTLKQRVGGRWGHLNNNQSAELLQQIKREKIQQLVLGHISLKNNAVERVRQAVEPVIDSVGAVHYACQEQGFGWLELE